MLEQNPKQKDPSVYLYRDFDTSPEGEVGLDSFFRALREYRTPILGLLGVALLAYILFAAVAYLYLPVHRVSAMRFRLDFEGVDRGEYPNGMKFRSAEIISTPVLTQVYEQNGLSRYLSFGNFKASLFVIESNPELERLDAEYRTRLADVRLSPVDRERIQKEYVAKRETLSTSEYSLNMVRDEHSLSMPAPLLQKVLDDILATWARFADERKGVLKYRVPVFSRNIVHKDALEANDYPIALDILRSKIVQVIRNSEAISKLPGAVVIRVNKDKISLSEVKSNLEDLLRFRLEPLTAMVTANNLSRDPGAAVVYAEGQLAKIKLERQEASVRVKTLEEALRQYMLGKGMVPTQAGPGGQPQTPTQDRSVSGLIPQIGESFLDKLIAMSTQNNDYKFRQDLIQRIIDEGLGVASLDKDVAYYEGFMQATKKLKPSSSFVKSDEIKAAQEKILDEILMAVDRVNQIYQEISALNLNPRTMLYTITGPTTTSATRPIRSIRILLYGALFMLGAALAIVAGCLIHARFSSSARLQSSAVPPV